MSVFLGFLCAATAFPLMLVERVFPYKPEPHKIEWDYGRTWYHNLKNVWTESVRADSQWYGKLLAFIIVLEFIGLIVAL